jgi:23S rRNA (adenine2503-C2)-methyltransferase
VSEAVKTNLLDLDREAMRAFFVDLGEKPYRADQVMKWIYHHLEDDFAAMTDLGKSLRVKLPEVCHVGAPATLYEKSSSDGTHKWLLGMRGGNAIETVYIPEPTRGTLCVSSQVGCALNCHFCSTGTQGFNRNLSTAEIIGQVWMAAKHLAAMPHQSRRITNVVMMGMGEPLANFDAVVAAMRLMRDDLGFGLASRRVTLSTAGLVPKIVKLADAIDVSLAISLHAANDDLRTRLMPINKRYPIAELIGACQHYLSTRPRASVTFEYTLMKGVNDQPEHARELIKLMRQLPSKVNLIPFNPFPGAPYARSRPEDIAAFQRILTAAGMVAPVRRTRGDDIDAACGQLKGQVIDRTRRHAQWRQQEQVHAA